MAKQGNTQSLELDINKHMQQLSVSTSATSSSDLSLSKKPRVMKLDFITLPQFNVTYISRCLTVSERLSILTHIHPRFREFILQPQCFPDMSFFPVSDESMYSPKILSSNGLCGITYVEVNIFSKHPFIPKVALLAGMWNFKADLWNRLDWPLRVNIESLQLTLDYTSTIDTIYLDQPPRLNFNLDSDQDDEQRNEASAQQEEQKEDNEDEDINEIQVEGDVMTPCNQALVAEIKQDDDAETSESGESDVSDENDGEGILQCISPTTRKPIDLKCRLRNLFFIKFDSSAGQPKIMLPKTLWGLGLQSFTSRLFEKSWWINQVQFEQRLENLRFLVLSCCEFHDNELQILLNSTRNVEHLSLRYCRWEGTIKFQKSLVSLGYFPDRNFEAFYDLSECNKLWQISTRYNEKEDESHKFLNAARKVLSIHRVKLEHLRRGQYADRDIDFRELQKWEQCANNEGFTVAMTEEEFNHYDLLREVFPISNDRFLTLEEVQFEDCPLWSDESRDFIHMTNKRKLLLR